VSRPRHVDRIEIALFDDAIHMQIDEVQARCRSPVAKQTRLDVLEPQRFAQQWVGKQIDLTNRQVVGGTPVGVHLTEKVRSERLVHPFCILQISGGAEAVANLRHSPGDRARLARPPTAREGRLSSIALP
jgi:hypothetical protein